MQGILYVNGWSTSLALESKPVLKIIIQLLYIIDIHPHKFPIYMISMLSTK